MQGQDEIDEDSELDAALNTIKSNEKKALPKSAKTHQSEKERAQAVLT